MGISATAIASSRRWPLIWRAAAALTLLIFFWQAPFFVRDLDQVWSQLLHHGYILAWMLLVTSFTRTLPLRTLAAFWFVGLFPVMALVLLITRPMDSLLGGELGKFYFGPLVEELIKPLPVVAFLAYRVWRKGWQLSATDGLLLGFVVGSGFAFHEDAGYGRVWGDGFARTQWSALFPTIDGFRGQVMPGHDSLSALVGLALGFAFLYRRYRLAWTVPLAVWLIVIAEHITGNLRDISGRASALAELIRDLLLDGQLPFAILVSGIVVTVLLEWLVLRSIARRDPLFPPIPVTDFLGALRQRSTGSLRRLQAMRVYARQRRSVYYTVWSEPTLAIEKRNEMAATLYGLGIEAGVPVDKTFADYDGAVEALPTELPAAPAPGLSAP